MFKKWRFRVSQPDREALGWQTGAGRRGGWEVCALLVAGLLATALAAHDVKSHVDSAERREFDLVCDEIRSTIFDRLDAHAQILRSGAAFYENADGVDRAKWHRYTERQNVAQQLPGIQGFGFAVLIPREQLEQRVSEIRAEGFPEFNVYPEGERAVYSAIIYLEPFADRNLRAFGYDMLSEPVRREAMERARDMDSAALSGKVRLVQETDQDIQAGTLMYVPVYRREMPSATNEQRRAALVGWVYSPYRMGDLMRGILGGWDLPGGQRIRLEVFDGEQVNQQALLYDSQSAEANQMGAAPGITVQRVVVAAGRQWTLRFTQMGNQESSIKYSSVWLVALGGVTISLLLSGLFFSLINVRVRARQMAARLTTELSQSEQRFRGYFNSPIVGAAITSPEKDWLETNVRFCTMLGYSREELLGGLNWAELTHPDDLAADLAQFERLMSGEIDDYWIDKRFVRKDGEIIWASVGKGSVRESDGTVNHVMSLILDITDRKQAEEALQFRAAFVINNPAPVLQTSSRGEIILCNPATEKLFGRNLRGEQVSEVFPDMGLTKASQIRDDLPGQFEYDTADSTFLFTVQHDLPNQAIYFYGANITKRKRAENLALEAQLLSDSILDTVREPLLVLDAKLRVTSASQSFCRLFHVTQEESEGQLLYDLGNGQWDIPTLRELLEEILPQNTRMDGFEVEHEFEDIGERFMLLNARRIFREGKDTETILLAIEDITKRKRAENLALEAQLLSDSILDTVREPLLVLDAKLRVTSASQSFCRVFHVTQEESEGQLLYDLGNGQWDIPTLRELLEEILPQNTRMDGFEVEHEFEDIGERFMLLNARRIFRERKDTETILLAIEDITDRKRAEEQIAASLQEKEVLLREIHHRVKNNMQVIVSLLRMHARRSHSERMRSVFDDCRDRVNAMSLIHEALYQSENLVRIDFEAYLTKLCRNLSAAHGSSGNGIVVKVGPCNMALDMDRGVAVGMVVSELVSNAFKHAFPSGAGGEVSVNLSNLDEETVELIVQDNGKGLPAEVDILNSPSLGLRLVVAAITRELAGSIGVVRNGGTRFVIRFNCKLS